MGMLPPGLVLFGCFAVDAFVWACVAALHLAHQMWITTADVCELCRATETLPRPCLPTSRIPRLVSPGMACLEGPPFPPNWFASLQLCLWAGCIRFQGMYSATVKECIQRLLVLSIDVFEFDT